MSAVPCQHCGKLRKVEQVSTGEGWSNPPCSHCGAPGWHQGYDEDPEATQPERHDPLAVDRVLHTPWKGVCNADDETWPCRRIRESWAILDEENEPR